MNKKLLMASSLLLFLILLVGCKGEEASSKGKSKSMEVNIEDGRFIIPTDGAEFEPDSDTGTIVLDVNIKNLSKQSIDIFPETDMALYDDDTQIDAKSIIDVSLDLDFLKNTSVGSDKQKVFPVAFEVEKDKVYELEITPISIDEDIAPVTLEVDMSEYSESYDTLNEPAEVLESYIEIVFFGKENDGLDELIDIDIEEQIDDAKDGYVKLLEKMSFADVPSKVASKYYDDFIDALNDKVQVDVQLKGNSGEKAIVEVNYEMLSYMDLGDSFTDHRSKYLEKSSSYDTDAADEHAFSKLDLIFKEAKPRENRYPLEIYMSKQDGKWSLDNKFGDPKVKLREVFAEGHNY